MTPVIVEIAVTDPPEAWHDAGFAVDPGGRCPVGTVVIRLGTEAEAGSGVGRGIVGWALAGVGPLGADGIDGLHTVPAPQEPRGPAPSHPNGVTRIDHVVVLTPDLDRTTAALAAAGVEPRRTREAGTGPDGVARRQRFFRLGEVILELVGPAEPTGGGPARFWGLAYEVADLTATAERLDGLLTEPRDAVQPGRRIAALRREAGLSVPTAFLSP